MKFVSEPKRGPVHNEGCLELVIIVAAAIAFYFFVVAMAAVFGTIQM